MQVLRTARMEGYSRLACEPVLRGGIRIVSVVGLAWFVNRCFTVSSNCQVLVINDPRLRAVLMCFGGGLGLNPSAMVRDDSQ